MFLVSVVCVVVLVCGGVMHARMCDVVHRICEVSLQWWCVWVVVERAVSVE